MIEKKMVWSNLKKNQCPKCDKDFMEGLVTIPFDLYGRRNQKMMHPCGFSITERRYSQIVNSQVTADLERKLQAEQDELL